MSDTQTIKKAYATRMFVNNIQIGSNCDFQDWYVSDEHALADNKDYFTVQGYEIESITIEQLPRWTGAEPVVTIVAKLRKKS